MTSSNVNAPVVAFLGLGLISGSLAGALRASGWGGDRIAWGPRLPSLEHGKRLGIVDHICLDLDEVLLRSDLVVIGAPPVATAELLPEVLTKALQYGEPVVTDMASVKGFIVEAATRHYPKFVPGHPIAGSENSGVEAARSDLFRGREVILTPTADTDPEAVTLVEDLWSAAGARMTHMSVAEHDAALAASSHVPHMISYALTAMLGDHALAPMKHGGGALRDMTRIAASDPVMWRDIALTNREAVLAAMDALSAEHDALRGLIADRDAEGLEQYFKQCRVLRREHDAVLNPALNDAEAPS
ncbi:MAG: prephenate dehydrogenase/arogenate dehydrogenase family protein [Luminiphilus sp.]|nr:prephenate dehydrogenase/arogenate dehydrogenase family protein [Luminiphilus sp.]